MVNTQYNVLDLRKTLAYADNMRIEIAHMLKIRRMKYNM